MRLISHTDIPSVLALDPAHLVASQTNKYLAENGELLTSMIWEHYEGMLFSVADDTEAEVTEVCMRAVQGLTARVVDISAGLVSAVVDCAIHFDAIAHLPDYGSSPVDCGEYVMLFEDVVRITAARDASFLVRIALDEETHEPCDIQELELIGDIHVALDPEEDGYEVIEHWSEHHHE